MLSWKLMRLRRNCWYNGNRNLNISLYIQQLVTWVRWVLVHPRRRGQGGLHIPHRRPPSGSGSDPRLSAKGFHPLEKVSLYANQIYDTKDCVKRHSLSITCNCHCLMQTSWSILPQPDFLFVNDVKEGGPSWSRVILGGTGEVLDAADDARVHSLLTVLVVLIAELPGREIKIRTTFLTQRTYRNESELIQSIILLSQFL